MKRFLYFVILCGIPTLLFSCVSFNGTNKDTLGLKLKKEAIEGKAAIRDIQYRKEKNRHPNYLGLARELTARGFYDIALVQLKEAEKTDKKNSEIFYLKGICLKKKKEYENALVQFERAVSVNPEYSYAYAGQGMIYDITGEHSRAVRCYTKAIRIDPGVPSFYNNLGVSFMVNKEAKKAVDYFKRCIALNPNSRRAANNLGLAYGMLGKDDRAFNIFKKLGNEAVAYNNMGYVCRIRGDKKKAIEMYRKAIVVNPGYASAKKNLMEIEKGIRGEL